MPVIDSPEFSHAFVPINSLTGSPMTSTGSTSVLEWNSNSGSDGFSVRSLGHEQYLDSSPSTPNIPTFSPNFSSPKTFPPDHDQIFTSFNSAAPVTDSVTTTVTSDTSVDEYHNLISALEERLTLQDSVTQWQHHSYRETTGLDRSDTLPDIERFDDVVHDKPLNNLAPSPNRSVVTDSSTSAVTAKHVSSLFLPPPTPPTPHLYSESPPVVSNNNQSEGISIAQYFQLKAAKVAEPVQPPVDAPLRPISAASCLSYASSVQSPATVPLPDRSVEAPLLHQTWIPKVDNSGPTMAYPPPIRPLRCYSSHPSWYQPTYSPNMGPPTPQNCFTDLHSSPSRKPQTENNNTGSQFNQSIGKVTVPSSQAADTPKSNSKSHAPSRTAWAIPPAISCQFEPATFKPIKPIIPNSPCVTFSNGSLHGKVSGKPANHPVPPASRTSVSPTPTFHWRGSDFSRPNPWSNEPRIRDIGQASPETTDSVLLPPPSTPSVSSPPLPGSPRSSISASAVPPSPPSPPLVDLQPPYWHHATPSNVPYIPLTPIPASPLNEVYPCTQPTPRALPIPSISRTSGLHTPFTPRYTGSTLPRDMHLSAAPPTPWGPTPRRLRFAPLPPTPSAGLPYTSAPGYSLPYTTPSYTTPLPPYPSYPMSYPYHAHGPAPQIPAPTSAPYSSWRSGPPNSPLWTPHPVFWYSDGSIVFRIENVGYKVHRHFFERHSTYFRDFLAYPTYSATSPTPHTIYLSDVKKVDFERLLLIFYPSNLVDPELFTVEEWTSVLSLSDKWNFAQLKTLAIRELGFITSTIEKIAMSKKYNIGNPQWLLAAYRELCTRRHPLSLVEGEKLGLETVIKIWETQHELMMGSTWGRSVDIVIQERFGLL